MTDNTQPEALRLAERMSSNTGHVGGPTMDATASELRRQHARIAELEAELEAVGAGGVQALSAAPAVPTSVKGAMWFTKKPVTIQAIQWTGENLREVITFTDGPPDTRSHHAGMAWDAYRDLVARDGLKIAALLGVWRYLCLTHFVPCYCCEAVQQAWRQAIALRSVHHLSLRISSTEA